MHKFLISILLLSGACCASFADEYYDQRYTLFEQLPVYSTDIVMLGNSITNGGEFDELFGMERVLNRGINADVMKGVEKRLHQITKGQPAKIFLLIGINDISHGISLGKLTENYRNLVQRIRRESPSTKLYLQSVMPINNDFARYKNLLGRESMVPALNEQIKKIAAEEGLTYIDLWPALAGEDGKLKKEYTNDGLHLLGAGYRAWSEVLKPYLAE